MERFSGGFAVNAMVSQCDLLRPAPETTRLRVLVPEFDMFNHSSNVPLGSSHKLNYSRGLVTAFTRQMSRKEVKRIFYARFWRGAPARNYRYGTVSHLSTKVMFHSNN